MALIRPDGKQPQLPEDWVFALDIGTRSVIGIVGQRHGDVFEMADMEILEHPGRAMIDGQIENIEQVAAVARQVKQNLESRLGVELHNVNVAAAGRALKTGRATFSMDVNTGSPITEQQMYELEIGAIAVAREQVQKTQEIAGRFYCVGHSVVRYHLDDYPFSTILGHKGEMASADVIATFLPAEVVDSLCAAMAKIGCEISHMTLEPIAAMNAVIPPDLRLLNLALVDIGAGTSDIAISENGSVAAYTMATIAGDEVTEELIKAYLVDFHTAERMKHETARGLGEIAYTDILGFDYTIPLEQSLETLRPAVETLAGEICQRILDANGKPPVAIFLVGGGSLAPGLCESVARNIGLDARRVAIGGDNYIKRVTGANRAVSGPAFATPIGIALTASTAGTGKGFFVTVNGEKVRLFRNDRMSIMDVLLSSGYQYKDLMGQGGKAVTYMLNGEKRIKRGGHLVPAQLFLNGKDASISTPVNCEDDIRLIPAQAGEDAVLNLTELGLDPMTFTVYFGKTPVQAGRFVTINGKPAACGQPILDLDTVHYTEAMTLQDLCVQIGMEWREDTFLLNDVYAEGGTPLKEGDVICFTQGVDIGSPVTLTEQPAETASEEQPVEAAKAAQPIAVQREPASAAVEQAPVAEQVWTEDNIDETVLEETEEEAPLQETEPEMPELPPPPPGRRRPHKGEALRVTINGKTRELPPKQDNYYYQFVDMLALVDIDPTNPQGDIVLLLNGQEPSYLDELFMDDVVDIRWENG